jgi:hypothetical protein
MGKTIYVVTTGCYSDYRIQAVFDDKPMAEAWVAEHNKDYDKDDDYAARIEKYPLNEQAGYIRRNLYCCAISLATGDVTHESNFEGSLASPHARAGEINVYPNPNCNEAVAESYVSAEHARKLAVEARQKHLREQVG